MVPKIALRSKCVYIPRTTCEKVKSPYVVTELKTQIYCSMSSMQHVARCFEMQRVRYSVTLLSRLQHVALKNTQRVA